MSSEDDYKNRIRNAIAVASGKALKEYKAKTRKNDKPEKLVEQQCLALMRSWGWSVEIYEAKATYDPRKGVWRNQAMKKGTSDSMGVTNDGIAVAVEFKAPGKLTTLRYDQREFLASRINQFAFACVVDSAELLRKYRNEWDLLRRNGNIEASRDYLMFLLPKSRADKSHEKIFFDDES